MKTIFKKLSVLLLVIFSVNVLAFSLDAQDMPLVQLNKEVLTLKYEIYQIDHRFGEFEEMNGLKLKIERAKREQELKKLEPVLKERNAENAEKAKEAASQAAKELAPKFKSMAEKGKEYTKKAAEAVSNFFNNVADKAEESGFIDELKSLIE